MEEAKRLFSQAGEIISVGAVIPENQMRGSFVLKGSSKSMKVSFTLTPEAEPRVQWITLELISSE